MCLWSDNCSLELKAESLLSGQTPRDLREESRSPTNRRLRYRLNIAFKFKSSSQSTLDCSQSKLLPVCDACTSLFRLGAITIKTVWRFENVFFLKMHSVWLVFPFMKGNLSWEDGKTWCEHVVTLIDLRKETGELERAENGSWWMLWEGKTFPSVYMRQKSGNYFSLRQQMQKHRLQLLQFINNCGGIWPFSCEIRFGFNS